MFIVSFMVETSRRDEVTIALRRNVENKIVKDLRLSQQDHDKDGVDLKK